MKALEVHGGFGLDRLLVTGRPDPRPGPGQLLLKMKAVSLNYRDLMTVRGEYNPRQPLPLIPCSDGLGEVVACGEGVTRFRVGERVLPLFAQRWLAGEPTREVQASTLGGPLDGTMAELMVVHEDSAVRAPDHLSDEEAACLPCAALTAWSALVTLGRIKAGEVLLVEGTGGVSVFGLQLGRLLGARVIATSSSPQKLERMLALGASDGIDYRQVPEWGRQARKLTGGAGVDHVLDVGGPETLPQALQALRLGGRISVIGVLSGTTAQISVVPILMQGLQLQGVFVGHRESFEAMNRAVALHGLRPVVDRVFPFEEARGAFEHLASRRHFGKVCIRFS